MKLFRRTLQLLLYAVSFLPTLSLRGLLENGSAGSDNEALACEIYIAHLLPDPDEESQPNANDGTIACIVNDMVYALPTDVSEMYKKELKSLEPITMYIEGGRLPAQWKKSGALGSNLENQIVVPKDAKVFFADNTRRRKLKGDQRKIGESGVLVMKVFANDASSTMTNQLLYDRIFSDGSNVDQDNGDLPAGTLSKTYQDCSFGQLNFVPATGYDIDNGIGFVNLDIDVIDVGNREVENAVTRAINAKYGSVEDWDHIVYCLPPGTKKGWVAYSYVNFYRSVYNDDWCGQNSAMVHELGHNIGLLHSNENGLYKDQTDMIGFSYNWIGGPRMCFNAHKNWVLGWYSSRQVKIDPASEPWFGAIVAYVDFSKTADDEYVLIHFSDIYLQYNRAKGINQQVLKYADRLVVTQAEGPHKSSESKGGIKEGEALEYESYSIEFCSSGTSGGKDFVYVSVYLTATGVGCSGAPSSLLPSTSPSQVASSPSPTRKISSKPSSDPSARPTMINPMAGTPSAVKPSIITPSTMPPTTPSKIPSLSLSEGVVPKGPSKAFHPSSAPSRSPSKMPSYDSCNDSRSEAFYVSFLPGLETCIWLRSRPNVAQVMCDEDHESQARSICPETCGACNDTCVDDIEVEFPVNGTIRNCHWVDLRPHLHGEECAVGKGAWNYCRETCGNCNPFPTSAPSGAPSLDETAGPTLTASPSIKNPYDSCDDNSDATYFVSETNKEEPCRWLESRVDMRLIYCNASHPSGAYDKCEETCGKCFDNCVDDNESPILVGETNRSCIYIAGRGRLINELCLEGLSAWNICRETCGSCLAPTNPPNSGGLAFNWSVFP